MHGGWSCDCYQCEAEARTETTREEERMTRLLTCNCASRYVRDAEHEGDCDLWLIDEFWAGWLAWDWDREILVPTHMFPPGETSDYVAEEYEWVSDSPVQQALGAMEGRAPNGQDVEDVMLTTDAFINRMLENHPEDDDDTWVKNNDGLWVKTKKLPSGGTSYTYGGHGTHPVSYNTPKDDDYGGYNWESYMGSDRHCQTPVHLADGLTTIYCTSLSKAGEAETVPDFALYLDMGWRPDSLAIMLPWRDYGLPIPSDAFADYAIKEAFSWAQAGAFVEIGCIGAHGRTGVVVACMAILADPELDPESAVAFVRASYCHHAIETREQEWWVARFHAEYHGLPVPEKPVYVPPKPTVVTHTGGTADSATPKAVPIVTQQGSLYGGPADPNKPGRKKRNRRSKRGGKRNKARQAVKA